MGIPHNLENDSNCLYYKSGMNLGNGGPVSGETEFFRWTWDPLGGRALSARWCTLDEFLLSF